MEPTLRDRPGSSGQNVDQVGGNVDGDDKSLPDGQNKETYVPVLRAKRPSSVIAEGQARRNSLAESLEMRRRDVGIQLKGLTVPSTASTDRSSSGCNLPTIAGLKPLPKSLLTTRDSAAARRRPSYQSVLAGPFAATSGLQYPSTSGIRNGGSVHRRSSICGYPLLQSSGVPGPADKPSDSALMRRPLLKDENSDNTTSVAVDSSHTAVGFKGPTSVYRQNGRPAEAEDVKQPECHVITSTSAGNKPSLLRRDVTTSGCVEGSKEDDLKRKFSPPPRAESPQLPTQKAEVDRIDALPAFGRPDERTLNAVCNGEEGSIEQLRLQGDVPVPLGSQNEDVIVVNPPASSSSRTVSGSGSVYSPPITVSGTSGRQAVATDTSLRRAEGLGDETDHHGVKSSPVTKEQRKETLDHRINDSAEPEVSECSPLSGEQLTTETDRMPRVQISATAVDQRQTEAASTVATVTGRVDTLELSNVERAPHGGGSSRVVTSGLQQDNVDLFGTGTGIASGSGSQEPTRLTPSHTAASKPLTECDDEALVPRVTAEVREISVQKSEPRHAVEEVKPAYRTASDHNLTEVVINKGVLGLGFCISGGKGSTSGDQPIVVRRLFKGETSVQGRLEPGDEIVTVNDTELSQMSHHEAWKMLKSLPEGPVRLLIRRK